MGADLTRDTFHPAKHFLRVLSQQGRVTVDADPNEQTSILLHYLETLVQDVVGSYGGPASDPGFLITVDANGNVTIGHGRYYVNGILCENEQDLSYKDQDGFANVPAPNLASNDYFYLDVWERTISSVQDDEIRESALGGPDTCARSKVVWQVWLGKDTVNADTSCQSQGTWLGSLPTLSDAELKVQLAPQDDGDVDPCSISPTSRYRGLENQLYRVQIHRSGGAWDGTTGGAADAATFKWSRDDGSVVFPIVSENGSVVTVESLGRDATMSLEADDWVEIVDDDVELVGEQPGILSGILAQVDSVDPVGLTVTLRAPADVANISWPTYDDTSTNHPFLRRWDQKEMDGLTFSEGAILITESSDPSTWIPIEDGIEVQFQPPDTGAPSRSYRAGDYWLVPARVATGKIEWPVDSSGGPVALPPIGIVHAYAPLAVIAHPANTLTDCRCSFKPLPCTLLSGVNKG